MFMSCKLNANLMFILFLGFAKMTQYTVFTIFHTTFDNIKPKPVMQRYQPVTIGILSDTRLLTENPKSVNSFFHYQRE